MSCGDQCGCLRSDIDGFITHRPGCPRVAASSAIPSPTPEPRPESYVGFLASGASVRGTKGAIKEMQSGIWRAEPTTDCAGQTWRDFAERCDRARMEADKRVADLSGIPQDVQDFYALPDPSPPPAGAAPPEDETALGGPVDIFAARQYPEIHEGQMCDECGSLCYHAAYCKFAPPVIRAGVRDAFDVLDFALRRTGADADADVKRAREKLGKAVGAAAGFYEQALHRVASRVATGKGE